MRPSWPKIRAKVVQALSDHVVSWLPGTACHGFSSREISPWTYSSSASLPRLVRSPPKITMSHGEALISSTATRNSESCTLPGVTWMSVRKATRSVSQGAGAGNADDAHSAPKHSRILEYFIGLAQFCRYKIRNSAEKAIFALQKTGGLFPISGARILVDNPVACDKSPPRRGFRGGSDLQMWPKAAGD